MKLITIPRNYIQQQLLFKNKLKKKKVSKYRIAKSAVVTREHSLCSCCLLQEMWETDWFTGSTLAK